MFFTVIEEKRAREIAGRITKGFEEYLPELTKFHEDGLSEEPRAIEIVNELIGRVNSGPYYKEAGVRIDAAYDDTNRLREYFLMMIPTVEAMETIFYYGEESIIKFWSQLK